MRVFYAKNRPCNIDRATATVPPPLIFLLVFGQKPTPKRGAISVIQRDRILARPARRIAQAIPPSCASHSQLSNGTPCDGFTPRWKGGGARGLPRAIFSTRARFRRFGSSNGHGLGSIPLQRISHDAWFFIKCVWSDSTDSYTVAVSRGSVIFHTSFENKRRFVAHHLRDS